jgi:hypothetical protein
MDNRSNNGSIGRNLQSLELEISVSHYKQGKIEAIEYIQANSLDFCEGNIIKYVTRYKHKGRPKEDLEKARYYLNRLLERY